MHLLINNYNNHNNKILAAFITTVNVRRYLLKKKLKKNIILFLFSVLLILNCKPKGPLTPEEALNVIKNAYLKSDAGQIEMILSERSKKKIRNIIYIISSMKEDQLLALSKAFDTNINNLRNLSIKDYLYLQILISKRMEEDILKEITKYKIIGTDIKNDNAVVRIENGMELFFVKEGQYWKYEITD